MPLQSFDDATIQQIDKAKGQVSNFFDLIKKAQSFRLWFTAWGVWYFTALGNQALPVDSSFSWAMYRLVVTLVIAYVSSETIVKFSALRVIEKRALSVELQAAIDKVSGT